MGKKTKHASDVIDVNLSEQAGSFDNIERAVKADTGADYDALSKEFASVTGFRADIASMLTEAGDDDKKQRAYNKLMWLLGTNKNRHVKLADDIARAFGQTN